METIANNKGKNTMQKRYHLTRISERMLQNIAKAVGYEIFIDRGACKESIRVYTKTGVEYFNNNKEAYNFLDHVFYANDSKQ